jgi:ketosteroid isomerase-like protein
LDRVELVKGAASNGWRYAPTGGYFPSRDRSSEMTNARCQDNASIVRAMYEAFRDRRRADAEALLAADFHFTSPYDDKIDRAAFFARCWPNGDRMSGFNIERVTADDDGAFITYYCTANEGTSFRNTEYLTVQGGKIVSADVYFGASYRDGRFVAKHVE